MFIAARIGERVLGLIKAGMPETEPQEQLFDPALIAGLEIEWRQELRSMEDIQRTWISRAALLHELDNSFGLTPEHAFDAAFHEWMAHAALTEAEQKARYLKHFESSKEGTTFDFDIQQAADILFETNHNNGYRENPKGFIKGVADLHQLVYNIKPDKSEEVLQAAQSYGDAIGSIVKGDYDTAQKHFEVFYTKLQELILSSR